jgi:hypothetical protein
MIGVALTIHLPGETREVSLTGERLSIGSGAPATLALDDDSLMPLHASINRAGDRVWLLEEELSGECYVNGVPVPPTGTPLADGDEVALGRRTTVKIRLRQSAAAPQAPTKQRARLRPSALSAGLALGLVVTLIAALALNSYAPQRGDAPRGAQSAEGEGSAVVGPGGSLSEGQGSSPASREPLLPAEPDRVGSADAAARAQPGQLYAAMTAAERNAFVAREAQHIARRIGNRDGAAFTPEALQRIKLNVDAYAARARLMPSRGCRFGQSLGTMLGRARLSAPFINRAFNERGLSPVVGLYLAMIESEFCPCLTSPTGPKGMFQFTRATAVNYGLRVVEPEERCIPEKAAPAAAQYMKALVGRYGTGPLSVPLAVASYNSGEGDLSRNLFTVLDAVRQAENPERSFWTLVANEALLTDQFQRENIKYVPKFFAAAVVGENPHTFGVELEPLSTY